MKEKVRFKRKKNEKKNKNKETRKTEKAATAAAMFEAPIILMLSMAEWRRHVLHLSRKRIWSH